MVFYGKKSDFFAFTFSKGGGRVRKGSGGIKLGRNRIRMYKKQGKEVKVKIEFNYS